MNGHSDHNLLYDLEPAETRASARPQAEAVFAWIAERARLIAELPPVEERTAIRERNGISVSDLARTIVSSRQFVRDFESGKAVPKGQHLERLVAFYRAVDRGEEAA